MVVTIGIEELLLQKFEHPAFSDCFIVEIKLANPNRLEVFVDSDTGISLEKCQKISRYLEQHLEEKKWLSENYTLEVSSPGINRPLKFVRQYKKNIGRTLDITLSDNTIKKGVLLKERQHTTTNPHTFSRHRKSNCKNFVCVTDY